MTVTLLVKHSNTDTESVPVSTQEFFEHFWRPIAERLDLQWIPLFGTGIPLDDEDVPLVLAELTMLHRAVAAQELELSEADRKYMLTRIDLLRNGLETALRDESVAQIFVG